MKIAIIILAAGSSTRMQTPKQLLNFKGKNLLQRAIDLACALEVENRMLVLGGWKETIQEKIDASEFDILFNANHKNGMSSSLQLAIKQVVPNSQIEGILIMLCDQPLIPKSHYEQLLEHAKHTDASIIATSYNQIMGVPCVFKSNRFEELLDLEGQQGAKFLLKKHKEEVVSVPCEMASFDIDTEKDYLDLMAKFQ